MVAVDDRLRLNGEIRRLTLLVESMGAEAERLMTLGERQQQAIDDRDALLKETQARAQALQVQLASAQEQINLRDSLLDSARAQFDRTLEGRIVACVRLLGRAVRRLGMGKRTA